MNPRNGNGSESRQEAELRRVRPATDVFETDDTLVLVADVPGADPTSTELELREDVLSVRAKPVLAAPEGWQPLDAEFELPAYERSFRLHTEVESDSIEASLQNGRLRVVLKKRRPRAARIEVRAS